MAEPLVWATTLKFLITVKQFGVPIDISAHRLLATFKLNRTDADPGIAQFDNQGLGGAYGTIVNKPQSGATLGQAILTMLDSVTRNGMANPTAGVGVPLYFNVLDDDGASDVYCPIGPDQITVIWNAATLRP